MKLSKYDKHLYKKTEYSNFDKMIIISEINQEKKLLIVNPGSNPSINEWFFLEYDFVSPILNMLKYKRNTSEEWGK